MSNTKKPRGYFEKALFIDAETSGLAFNAIDPTYDEATGNTYQAVSIGLVVADSSTLEPVDELYVEIKWNGESTWSPAAEAVHGLSLAYLEEHGISEEDAVVEIATFILKYWGPEGVICLGGHNVARFDLFYLKRLMESQGINLRFGSRTIDSSAVGFVALETYNSDDLFELVGLPERDPAKHNALTDAHNSLTACRMIRKMIAAS